MSIKNTRSPVSRLFMKLKPPQDVALRRIWFSKLIFLVFLIVFHFIGYMVTNKITFKWGTPIKVDFSVEAAIPFIPWFIYVYMLVYVLPIAGFLMIKDFKGFVRLGYAFIFASVICFVIWTIYPVYFELRPNLQDARGITVAVVRFFYRIDNTVNCFPSMHVTFAFLTYFGMLHFRREFASAFLTLALAVTLATLFVKQHYVLDLVSAYLLSWVAETLFIKNDYWEKFHAPIDRLLLQLAATLDNKLKKG